MSRSNVLVSVWMKFFLVKNTIFWGESAKNVNRQNIFDVINVLRSYLCVPFVLFLRSIPINIKLIVVTRSFS